MPDPIRLIRARRVAEDGTAVEVEARIFPPYRHHEMEQKHAMSLPCEEEKGANGHSDNDEPFELWACDVELPFEPKNRPMFGVGAAHAIELSVKFAKIMFDYSGYIVEPSYPDAVQLDVSEIPLTLVKTIRACKLAGGEARHTSARIYAPHYHADFDMWFCPLQLPFLGKKMHRRIWSGDAAAAADMGEADVMDVLAHYGFMIVPDE